MNIVVCIKQVPATEARIKVNSEGNDIERDELPYVVNPYDEFAVEEGLRIKERIGDSSLTVVSIGTERVVSALRTCLAMGADKAVHVIDDGINCCDSYKTALILSKVLKSIPYDIILFGKHAIDDDNGAVGIQTGELSGIGHISVVNKLELDHENKKVTANRQIEGGIEVIDANLPVIITCQKGMNEPRYPSLPGIMKAKQKPLQKIGLEELGLTPDVMENNASKIRLINMSDPPKREAGRIIQGSHQDAVKELVNLLKGESKVI
ncbi:MAG: electron transfer flavoprotein subunit beta/FixA family protein [Nitrospirota bacterium]